MSKPRVETEIKLFAPHPRCAPPLLESLAERHGVALRSGREVEQTDRYLDTDGMHLAPAGIGLRIRRRDGDATLGLKAAARVRGAVHRREELEVELAADAAPRRAADLPPKFRDRVEPFVHDRALRGVVELHNRRHLWRAACDDQGAELCLDRVTVTDPAGREVARFDEIEIEIDGERPADGWLDFAAALCTDLGLEPSTADKLQRALGYGRAEVLPAAPPTLDQSMLGAGRAVLAGHLHRLQVEESRVRLGRKVDAVHKLRVACRRLRSTLATFADAFDPEQRRTIGRFGKRTASLFGEVRDIDVLLVWIDAQPDADEPAARHARRRLARRRDRIAKDAVTALARPKRLALGAATVDLLTGPSSAGCDFSARIADAAPARIRAALAEVVDHAERIGPGSPAEDLHELRIRTKRLRYTAECFTALYGSDLGLFVDRATVLQDALGEFHDACVAADRLRFLAAAEGFGSDELLVVGGWIERQRRRARKARRRFEAAWADFDAHDLDTALNAALRGARPA